MWKELAILTHAAGYKQRQITNLLAAAKGAATQETCSTIDLKANPNSNCGV